MKAIPSVSHRIMQLCFCKYDFRGCSFYSNQQADLRRCVKAKIWAPPKQERGQATLPDLEPFKLDRLAQRRESFSHCYRMVVLTSWDHTS